MSLNDQLLAIDRRIAEIEPSAPRVTPADAALFSSYVQNGTGSNASPLSIPAAAPAAPEAIKALANDAAAANGVDANLVNAVIENESGYDPNATSSTGAQGLMQLMPSTAADLGVSNAYDPAQNIAGGTKYLHDLLQRYHGDVSLAVAAYNAGPGAVDNAHGIPNIAETQTYVQRVLATYARNSAQP